MLEGAVVDAILWTPRWPEQKTLILTEYLKQNQDGGEGARGCARFTLKYGVMWRQTEYDFASFNVAENVLKVLIWKFLNKT